MIDDGCSFLCRTAGQYGYRLGAGQEAARTDLGDPGTAELTDRLRNAELTYREVGQTAGMIPPGHHQVRRSVAAGSGAQAFSDAAHALLSWQAHLRAGLRVQPPSATAARGTVVVLGLGAGPIQIAAPCRVVYIVDEPDRQGFAYGTLPGHPESGEESFVIERRADGTVTFTITAFSRPATLLAKAACPATRAIQHHMTTRYLRSLSS